MPTNNHIAEIGALIGDPSRTGILLALMDGRALSAGELAWTVGITAPTASGHLARLTEAGLLAVESQGRHRYFRLASPKVAELLESVMAMVAVRDDSRRPVRTGPSDSALRLARSCYDHLAGSVAVAVADGMVERGLLQFSEDGGSLSEEGAAFLARLGIPIAGRSSEGRRYCRACLDWSVRRPHIAGRVGSGMLTHFLDTGWMRRQSDSRAIAVTPLGERELAKHFGVDVGRLTGS